ncbi:hypothetical protein [Kineosporia sp. A_224]|uniref:hypothetical protein n=1 Tax=Kineosporia sp. A_224 TaxID=1962180 RepID=UPI000B4ADEC7|nr:hypothetical protein [Kineosporia sp. A_224]
MSTHEDRTVAMPVTRPEEHVDTTVDGTVDSTVDGEHRLPDEWATDDRQPGERATDEGMPPPGAGSHVADAAPERPAGAEQRTRLGGPDGHDEPGWRSELTTPGTSTTSTTGSVGGDTAAADDAWRRLAGDFVDDPRHAVEQGRVLVQQAVDAMMAKAGIGPDGVAGGGQGDTENLRQAFRRLRDLHRSVSGI